MIIARITALTCAALCLLVATGCINRGQRQKKTEIAAVHITADPNIVWIVVAEESETRVPGSRGEPGGPKTRVVTHHLFLCIREQPDKPPRCYSPHWFPAAAIPALVNN